MHGIFFLIFSVLFRVSVAIGYTALMGDDEKKLLNYLKKSAAAKEKDKKRITYKGGHLVPKSELMKESLFWFDKYLGIIK